MIAYPNGNGPERHKGRGDVDPYLDLPIAGPGRMYAPPINPFPKTIPEHLWNYATPVERRRMAEHEQRHSDSGG